MKGCTLQGRKLVVSVGSPSGDEERADVSGASWGGKGRVSIDKPTLTKRGKRECVKLVWDRYGEKGDGNGMGKGGRDGGVEVF